ncbi:hypothetical protein [Streptomyces ossamyceticus]|uniref:hypothetical protein n=1 Tax=Streptomyces ossamyceticus TaxID=249581 RepID=UPI0034157115
MTEPTTTTTTKPAVPVPSQEEIDAALRTLMRAWAPSIPLPGDPEPEADEDDYYDPDDGCGCAGETEDGEQRYCNCGPGCCCESCEYFDYARYKRCWARPDGNACAGTPTLRVVAFQMQTTHVTERVADGASCPHAEGEPHHCTERAVYHQAGRKEQTYWFQPACSVAHAQALIAQNDSGLEYRIERWSYTPHDTELPDPLPALRERTQAAHSAMKWVLDTLDSPGCVDVWMAGLREHIACAAWNAARPLERPGEDNQADEEPATPPQEEPSDPWNEDAHAVSDPEDAFDYAMDREPLDGHDCDEECDR